MRNRYFFAAVLALQTAASFAADANGWSAPSCRKVSGTPSVTATGDEGATMARTEGQMAPVSYTFGLTPLDLPNTLLATVGSKVIRSTDAGCQWLPLMDLSSATGGALLTLTPAKGGSAYAWAVNDIPLYSIAGEQATKLRNPGGAGLMGFAVDANDGLHIRAGDSNGAVWDSRDGGMNWTHLGTYSGILVYRFAFDPQNLDHVVVGSLAQGASVSFDGGATWQASTGFSATGGSVNVFNTVVSPVDGKVVWAMGLDIDDLSSPSQGRHIYASKDGGRTFRKVVDQDARVTLINGPTMVAHPTEKGVLYFIFGMSFGGYGTDLYRYDAKTREVTLTHSQYDEIGAIAFHPADPRLMYLGLINEP